MGFDHIDNLDDLRAQIEPLAGFVGRKIFHVKSDGWYRVTSIHFRESDMTVEFTYQTLHKVPVTFSRPIAELLDGRFRIGI